MITSVEQIEWLESRVEDILRRMEGVELVTERWSDIPTHTINSIHKLSRAAWDLQFAIQDWHARRESPTTATIVKIADYIGTNSTAHTQGAR
jgi:hypothetical protein